MEYFEKTITCSTCGKPFTLMVTEDFEYNNNIQCGDCYDDPYSTAGFSDIPSGCRTCGNADNYPDCYEACPMNPD